MRTRGPGRISLAARTLLITLAVPCAFSACLVFVSTGPSHVEDATLFFVVRDDGGGFVAHVHVTVAGVNDDWFAGGFTVADGSFRCRLKSGLRRVRVSIDPPAGYACDSWPRVFDVEQVHDPIEVRVSRRW